MLAAACVSLLEGRETMKPLRVETRYDEELGLHVAVAPDLYFCTGLGATPEEALARLEMGITLWFDDEGGPLCGPECRLGDGDEGLES